MKKLLVLSFAIVSILIPAFFANAAETWSVNRITSGAYSFVFEFGVKNLDTYGTSGNFNLQNLNSETPPYNIIKQVNLVHDNKNDTNPDNDTIKATAIFKDLVLGGSYSAYVSVGNTILGKNYIFKVTPEDKKVDMVNFSPREGIVGTVVTILGKNLSSVDEITFNGIKATQIESKTDTAIKVKVPAKATQGKIVVKSASYGSSTSLADFKVTTPVVVKITSVSPAAGKEGDMIAITGENFVGVKKITFNTAGAIATTNPNSTTITVAVPGGAATGPITISTESFGYAKTAFDFRVTDQVDNTISNIKNSAAGGVPTDPTKVDRSGFSGLVPSCNKGALEYDANGKATGRYAFACDFDAIISMINHAINYFTIFLATPLFAIIIVYAGGLYISAVGDPGNVTKAKKIIKNSLIGYVIVLVSWLVIKTILVSLGFTGPTFLG